MPREARKRRSPREAGSEECMRLGGRENSPSIAVLAQCAVADVGGSTFFRWESEPGRWHALRSDRGFLRHVEWTVRPVSASAVDRVLQVLGMEHPDRAAWKPADPDAPLAIRSACERRAA